MKKEDNIMTVEEFLESKSIDPNNYTIHDITNNYLPQIPIGEWLKEFAKYHVQKALEAASIKVKLSVDLHDFIEDSWTKGDKIDKDSILNAYPLENVK